MSKLMYKGEVFGGGIPKNQVENILGNFASEYDSTSTYAVGSYVIYDGLLYKCITAVETAEAFDSSKWVQTDCGAELENNHYNFEVSITGDVADYVGSAESGFAFLNITGDYTTVGTLNTDYTYTTGYYTKRANGTATIVIHNRLVNAFIKKTRYGTGEWSDWEEFTSSTWKSTAVWTTAYNNAMSEIMVKLGAINPIDGTRVAYTILIPKASITSTKEFFCDGFYYNNTAYSLAQVAVSIESISNATVTIGNATNICDSVELYYR